jgi:hypothetical protein
MARNMGFGMAGFVLDAVVMFATTISLTKTLFNEAIGMS